MIDKYEMNFDRIMLHYWAHKLWLLSDLWRTLEEYNGIHPLGSLRGLSPLQFLRNFRSDKSIIKKMKLPDNLTLEVD